MNDIAVIAPEAAPAPAAAPAMPFVTVVIPTLDEAAHIERCVSSLLEDPYPRERLEVLIVDGGSRDRTVAIARALASRYGFIRVLANPRRIQAVAFNLAMQACDERCDYLLRCDAHAVYPPGFIGRAVGAMAESGAALVTFADAPEAATCMQRAIAYAQTTPLGVGNSWYRRGGVSGYVDHGKHGCFDRAAVDRVAGYDESFTHNEDSELSLRLRRAGERIWLDAGLAVGYAPRATLEALARQYYRYGRGRARTVLKHRIAPSPRQLAPAALVAAEILLLIAAQRRPRRLWLLAPYAAALAAAGIHGALRQRSACVLLAPLALAVMHHAWGLGFLRQIAGGSPPSVAGRAGLG
jgi:succinoglycan biosynthesis protein ExoA